MSESQQDRLKKDNYRTMTVAQIRERKGADHIEVAFLESARFYKLFRQHPAYDVLLKLLRSAMAKGRALQVRCASPNSDLIEDVQELNWDASESDE